MTARTDHAALAQVLIDVEHSDAIRGVGWETADAQHLANLAEAQVHATLALVEQQRIANLLTLVGGAVGPSTMGDAAKIAELISKGLGL